VIDHALEVPDAVKIANPNGARKWRVFCTTDGTMHIDEGL